MAGWGDDLLTAGSIAFYTLWRFSSIEIVSSTPAWRSAAEERHAGCTGARPWRHVYSAIAVRFRSGRIRAPGLAREDICADYRIIRSLAARQLPRGFLTSVLTEEGPARNRGSPPSEPRGLRLRPAHHGALQKRGDAADAGVTVGAKRESGRQGAGAAVARLASSPTSPMPYCLAADDPC